MTRWTQAVSAAALAAVLSGCAFLPPAEPIASPPGFGMAPRAVDFSFDDAPLAPAEAFPPWSALVSASAATEATLDACLADAGACSSDDLVRYRRMLEVARGLAPKQQLSLVHEYFNLVVWSSEAG